MVNRVLHFHTEDNNNIFNDLTLNYEKETYLSKSTKIFKDNETKIDNKNDNNNINEEKCMKNYDSSGHFNTLTMIIIPFLKRKTKKSITTYITKHSIQQ